jgi:hypothetical protein
MPGFLAMADAAGLLVVLSQPFMQRALLGGLLTGWASAWESCWG